MKDVTPIEPVRAGTKELQLSGLLATPTGSLVNGRSRGVILALHGGGYSAGYWNCPADGASLLDLGARLGFHVLALDRPGYGISRDFAPARLGLSAQVDLLFDALEDWCGRHACGDSRFVIGHSIGGILALLMAAAPRAKGLSGIDVLGVPIRFPESAGGSEVTSWATNQSHLPVLPEDLRKALCFGPPGTYSAEADEYDRSLLRPMPAADHVDALGMPDAWETVRSRIDLPVQFTLAEFEVMQVTGEAVLETVRARLRNSRLCSTRLQLASGHNASVHRIARAYHLRAIAFFEECMALQKAAAPTL